MTELTPNLPRLPSNGLMTNGQQKNASGGGYTAKNVYFFKEGDEYFQGVRVPVTKARYRTMESLLDDLTEKVPLYFGVRRVFTPTGTREVRSIDELENLGRYVCTSSKWTKGLTASERHQQHYKERATAFENERFAQRRDRSYDISPKFRKERVQLQSLFTTSTSFPVNSAANKQVLFVLNGMPNRVYRMQFQMRRLPEFDVVLRELTEMLHVPVAKLYSMDGNKVNSVAEIISSGYAQLLACQRNERPTVNGKLPPITMANGFSAKTSSPTKQQRQPLVSKAANGAAPRLPALSGKPSTAVEVKTPKRLRRRTISKRKRKKIVDKFVVDEVPVSGTAARSAEKTEAALQIQTAFRGFKARKMVYLKNELGAGKRKPSQVSDLAVEAPAESGSRPKQLAKNVKQKPSSKTDCIYEVAVYVGNRWAADSDANLYIILHGENGDSAKLWLRPSSEQPSFQQNQVASFEIEAPYVGKLKKSTIGHEQLGYGAGIYIDRLVINEANIDALQYVFLITKWFDSAQVDGKIERVVNCLGYHEIKGELGQNSEEATSTASSNRFNIRVSVGRVVAEPFTAQVRMIACGNFGRSDPIDLPEDFVIATDSTCSFEVNLADLGDLYKLRFESEQLVDQAWCLDWVELKDLDTGVLTRLTVNKWLSVKAPAGVKVLHPQTFREVPILRVGLEPLPVFQYNGTIQLTKNRQGCRTGQAYVQLTGEFGESGQYPVELPPVPTSGENSEIKFVIESVSLGRLMFISLLVPAEDKGLVFVESFRALQEIYDKHSVPFAVATDWLVMRASVRESSHAPYQFIFAESRVDANGKYVRKNLMLADMEGLTTMSSKASKAKATASQKSKTAGASQKWQVSVATGEHANAGTDCTPYLVVYGDKGKSKPIPLLDKQQRFTPGSLCTFKIDLSNIGHIFKVRVRLDTSGPKPMWYLKNMKMKSIDNGDELRFPVEMWLEQTDENPEVSIELPAVWPDIPPLPTLLYHVTLCTGTESTNETDFDIYMVIHGEKGDTGKRFLRSPVGTQDISCFKPGNVDTFELEAVSVRTVSKVNIGLEPRKGGGSWFLARLEILDPESDRLYLFECNKWFSDSKDEKVLERDLVATSVVDSME